MYLAIPFRIKFLVARTLGVFLSRYTNEKELYKRLCDEVPSFMSQSRSPLAHKKVLFLGTSSEYVKVEALFFKLMESLGYKVYVLTPYNPYAKRIFALFGIKHVFFPESYYQKKSLSLYKSQAEKILKECSDFNDLVKFKLGHTKVGEYAASSAMRITRDSSIDLRDKLMLKQIIKILKQSLRATDMARDLINDIKPEIIILNDFAYTPNGQIFDEALYARGTEVLIIGNSYNSNLFIFRKYNQTEKDIRLHPYSILEKDWEKIQELEWNEAYWTKLYEELKDNYVKGSWYSSVGTQFGKKIYSKEDLVNVLNIDKNKETAILFSHIFWDASFAFGVDLFDNYYDWFVNVLKIAKDKTNINWIIKIHPANSTKAARDNYTGSHKELDAIEDVFGSYLPEHIKILPPESDINTFSLFSVMDYCLTVRGTIGIESAALGVRTLLAGTGRYDNKGFTFDYVTKDDYLNALSNIEKTQKMSQEMIRLARIHAYYLLKKKSLKVDKVDITNEFDLQATLRVIYRFSDFTEFESSNFSKEFRRFMISDHNDYFKGQI